MGKMKMDAAQVETLFTRSDGSYAFSRWGRSIAPVVFGVDDATLQVINAALKSVTEMAGHHVAEMDPELGSNLMMFFFSEWEELLEVPGMEKLVPDLGPLVDRLRDADANQYRFFRFDDEGAIKACFVFLRMDAHLSEVPAQTLALSQIVQSFLLWSDTAFKDRSPLAINDDAVFMQRDIADVLRAAYDPVMPAAAKDASHALRLAARIEVIQ